MPFPESIAREVRHRAHYQCCLCKAIGVEIHHIVPQADAGENTIENAAPLCPSCHETYGANPIKRKFIREARDFWFEVCAKRYTSDPSVLTAIQSSLESVASRQDIHDLRSELAAFRFAKTATTINIPLNKSVPGEKRWLDIRDLLVMVHSSAYPRSSAQVDILCMRELWPVGRDDYRGIYKDFLRRFGHSTLRHLALRALQNFNVLDANHIAEPDLIDTLSRMQSEAVCMNLLDEGSIGAVLSDCGEILWTGARKK
jgi:hypothetical protein